MAHTPTPWSVVDHRGYMIDDETAIAVVGSDGRTVADNESFYPAAITAENAAFIVKAVNAHEELLAALLMARESFIVAGSMPLSDADALEVINAAIAKASP